jgi:hypothetical protein
VTSSDSGKILNMSVCFDKNQHQYWNNWFDFEIKLLISLCLWKHKMNISFKDDSLQENGFVCLKKKKRWIGKYYFKSSNYNIYFSFQMIHFYRKIIIQLN